MNLNIHDFLRLDVVQRWTIVNTARRQSVAEHSFRVAIIAMHLWEHINPGRDSALTCFAAIMHDVTESRTGDVPTPAKRYIREMAGTTIFDNIERNLTGDPKWPQEIDSFVKLADLMEAAIWIHENAVGAHARLIADRLYIKMEERVREYNNSRDDDLWLTTVNEVLMAAGVPVIVHGSWVRTT